MRARVDPSPELLQLADLQAGVLTAEQAAAYGLGRESLQRLVIDRQWQRLTKGIYLVQRTEPAWLALAWSGVLLGGDGARLGGEAAAHLQGWQAEAPDLIDVWVPHEIRVRDRGPWTFKRERAGIRRRSIGSPPQLGVEDTVLDLASGANEAEVMNAVTRAVQQRRTTASRLRRRMAEREYVAHRQLLGGLLSDVSDGAESFLEIAYLRQVERAHGLPKGRRQARNAAGHVRDVRYDQFATVIELDGRTGHEGLGRFRDMARDNYATLQGELSLRFGYVDVVSQPCLVAAQVAHVLVGRGWAGLPTRCINCRTAPDFWGN